ncbi:MAG: globin [Hyphomonas sp.]|uniref:globin n=1 Tax=Hyphomonas sp. TaxID=87 RepID=UPI0017DD8F13|nr:globin [Hyphomonas sp.]MBU3921230.1 globin [Alphaproteobacteria bacterium]MBA3067139.1 globin [Hyphomonas sp.]MBU4063065.1 globin [Alphaproteobacteria bacterium]MBU4164382.1 globin [Alphaproteobacteria bacterium]MBU4568832.1 globin [Alphaproteobacteria bacterium]
MTAAIILDTLERAGDKCADPAPLVYRRLFELRPDFEALFVMDSDGGVRGSMLATCFNAILGVLDDSPSQRVIISSSRFSHGGYGLADADLDLMFTAIRDTFRDLLGPDWTPEAEAAWAGLLAEIAAIT